MGPLKISCALNLLLVIKRIYTSSQYDADLNDGASGTSVNGMAKNHSQFSASTVYTAYIVINPRRALSPRVTVVILCLCICLSVYLFPL